MFVNKYFTYSFTKISTDSARFGGPDRKIKPTPGTNHIASFVQFHPLTNREKDKTKFVFFSAPERVKLNKFYNLIGSWGGRNFLLRTATASEPVGSINLSPFLHLHRRFITASYIFLRWGEGGGDSTNLAI